MKQSAPGTRHPPMRSPSPAVMGLRAPASIRERCHNVLQAGLAGELLHFEVCLENLSEVADLTAQVTRRRYPDLRVPAHGRMAHFNVGGVARTEALLSHLSERSAAARAQALFDVVVTSVLLDAGSGPDWIYREAATGFTLRRSEGLAVASLRWLETGALSSRGLSYEVDAAGLLGVTDDALATAFQVSDENPLVGVAGRAQLLRSLGQVLTDRRDLFGAEGRIGGLFDHLRGGADRGRLPASAILAALLDGFGPVWPGRVVRDGVALGDVWAHRHAGGDGVGAGLVPFHKLSQWLTYSLFEPIEAAGFQVVAAGELTGLAEYRNGGLLVDAGVLVPKYRDVTAAAHAVDAEVIVEWRALTVALLDRVVPLVNACLGVFDGPAALPLASVLEGGTWMAGRELAGRLRSDGSPPIRIRSDGTVF